MKIESQRKRPSASVAEREKVALFMHLMIFSINLTGPNSFPVLAAVVRWDADSICDATLAETSPFEGVPKSKPCRTFPISLYFIVIASRSAAKMQAFDKAGAEEGGRKSNGDISLTVRPGSP